MKPSKINFNSEWQFLQKCEESRHASIPGKQRFIEGKQRFIEFLRVARKIPTPKSILDIGGNFVTAKWFKEKFPKTKITILNTSKREIGSYQHAIEADAQCFKIQEKYDLIFAGEIIEHIYNPDGLISCCLNALKPKGYLVITTPNLACIYNRFFLAFGWTPGNYSPSLRYFTGNPFFSENNEFGLIADHKSVFTWKALYELLKIYGFQIIDCRGYSYGQKEALLTMGEKYYRAPKKGKLRLLLNKILPKKLREGMLFLCQAPNNTNNSRLSNAILKKSLWE